MSFRRGIRSAGGIRERAHPVSSPRSALRMILLDTNVISETQRQEPQARVLDWLDAQALETLYLSAITVAELREIAQKLDRAEILPEADYHLSFSDSVQLFRELTPARLVLLKHLKKNGPQSIYELARQLNRNYSNVHTDVQKLTEHHLIDKTEDQQIFVPWDDVEIHLSLSAVA